MRFLTMTAFVLAMTTPSLADDGVDTCSHASGLAHAIMEGRQAGVPAADMMKKVLPVVPEGSHGLMRDLIVSAYETPRFSTDRVQQQAIGDFSDEVFVSCMQAY